MSTVALACEALLEDTTRESIDGRRGPDRTLVARRAGDPFLYFPSPP
jgi:hypothetical protein